MPTGNPRRRKTLQRKHLSDLLVLLLTAYHESGPYLGLARPLAYRVLLDHGWPDKLIEAKFLHLYDRGLLEWGVSVRTCYLTPLGHAYLQEHRDELVATAQGPLGPPVVEVAL